MNFKLTFPDFDDLVAFVFRPVSEGAHEVIVRVYFQHGAELHFVEQFAGIAVREGADRIRLGNRDDFSVFDDIILSLAAVGERNEDCIGFGRHVENVSEAHILKYLRHVSARQGAYGQRLVFNELSRLVIRLIRARRFGRFQIADDFIFGRVDDKGILFVVLVGKGASRGSRSLDRLRGNIISVFCYPAFRRFVVGVYDAVGVGNRICRPVVFVGKGKHFHGIRRFVVCIRFALGAVKQCANHGVGVVYISHDGGQTDLVEHLIGVGGQRAEGSGLCVAQHDDVALLVEGIILSFLAVAKRHEEGITVVCLLQHSRLVEHGAYFYVVYGILKKGAHFRKRRGEEHICVDDDAVFSHLFRQFFGGFAHHGGEFFQRRKAGVAVLEVGGELV